MASPKKSYARLACEINATSFRKNLTLFATAAVEHAVRDVDAVFTATSVREDMNVVRSKWLRDDAITCSISFLSGG